MTTNREIQYTLRGIPAPVDRALRERAEREGKSLNQTALELLTQSLGLADEEVIHNDLDDLAGTWEADPGFDEAIREMDRMTPAFQLPRLD